MPLIEILCEYSLVEFIECDHSVTRDFIASLQQELIRATGKTNINGK